MAGGGGGRRGRGGSGRGERGGGGSGKRADMVVFGVGGGGVGGGACGGGVHVASGVERGCGYGSGSRNRWGLGGEEAGRAAGGRAEGVWRASAAVMVAYEGCQYENGSFTNVLLGYRWPPGNVNIKRRFVDEEFQDE